MTEMVTISAAADAIGVNKSSVSRYLQDKDGELFDLKVEGRSKLINLEKFRAHYEANMRTPIMADVSSAQPKAAASLPSDDADPALLPRDEVQQLKLRRERLLLKERELEYAKKRGDLVPVADFEGLGERVGATLREGLFDGLKELRGNLNAASSEREKDVLLRQHMNRVLERIADALEAQAKRLPEPA